MNHLCVKKFLNLVFFVALIVLLVLLVIYLIPSKTKEETKKRRMNNLIFEGLELKTNDFKSKITPPTEYLKNWGLSDLKDIKISKQIFKTSDLIVAFQEENLNFIRLTVGRVGKDIYFLCAMDKDYFNPNLPYPKFDNFLNKIIKLNSKRKRNNKLGLMLDLIDSSVLYQFSQVLSKKISSVDFPMILRTQFGAKNVRIEKKDNQNEKKKINTNHVDYLKFLAVFNNNYYPNAIFSLSPYVPLTQKYQSRDFLTFVSYLNRFYKRLDFLSLEINLSQISVDFSFEKFLNLIERNSKKKNYYITLVVKKKIISFYF